MQATIKKVFEEMGFEFINGCWQAEGFFRAVVNDCDIEFTCMVGNVIDTQFRLSLSCVGDLDIAESLIRKTVEAVLAG